MLYDKLMFAVCVVLICLVSAAMEAARKSGNGEVRSKLKWIAAGLSLGAMSYLVRMPEFRHHGGSQMPAVVLVGCGIVVAILAWTRRPSVHQE